MPASGAPPGTGVGDAGGGPSPDRALLARLSPETRLLLAAAPAAPDRDRLAAGLGAGIRWDRLTELLVRERATVPFWRRVRPLADRIEPEAREGLERRAAADELRMRLLARRLAESLDVLEEAGLEAMVLKGGALAHTLYPDPGERPMADLDLLVRPERGEEARRALASAGWRRDEDRYPGESYRRHYHLPPLRDEGGSGAALEIHTGLLLPGHPFALGPETLRRRARTASIRGRPLRVPDPVDHLVYLCLHFAWGHALESGAWRTARDVGVLAGAEGFSWEIFLDRVREAGAGPFAHWTLRLAARLCGRTSPPAVREALRPPLPGPLLRRLDRHFAAQLFVTEPGCPSVWLRRRLWTLATRPAGGRPPGVRPWSHIEDFLESGDGEGEPRPGALGRIRGHLARSDRWRAYLSRTLGAGRSRGPGRT